MHEFKIDEGEEGDDENAFIGLWFIIEKGEGEEVVENVELDDDDDDDEGCGNTEEVARDGEDGLILSTDKDDVDMNDSLDSLK